MEEINTENITEPLSKAPDLLGELAGDIAEIIVTVGAAVVAVKIFFDKIQ